MLARFAADKAALDSAHEQAVEASRPLVAELLTKHAEPVPFIRMDWMVKRRPDGTVGRWWATWSPAVGWSC